MMKSTYAIFSRLLSRVFQDDRLAIPLDIVHIGAHRLELLDVWLDVVVVPDLDVGRIAYRSCQLLRNENAGDAFWPQHEHCQIR